MSFIFYSNPNLAIQPMFNIVNKNITLPWLIAVIQLLFSQPSFWVILIEIINGSTRNKFAKILHKLLMNPIKSDYIYDVQAYVNANFKASSPNRAFIEGLCFIINAVNHKNIKKLFSVSYGATFNCISCEQIVSTRVNDALYISLRDVHEEINTTDQYQKYILGRMKIIDSHRCEACNNVVCDVKRIERMQHIRDILLIELNDCTTWYPNELIIPYYAETNNGYKEGDLYYRATTFITTNGLYSIYSAKCLRKDNDDISWYNVGDLRDDMKQSLLVAYHVDKIIYTTLC
jgi:hypothetical protein